MSCCCCCLGISNDAHQAAITMIRLIITICIAWLDQRFRAVDDDGDGDGGIELSGEDNSSPLLKSF